MGDDYISQMMEYVMLREKITFMNMEIDSLQRERAKEEAKLVELKRRMKSERYGSNNS